VKTLAMYGTLPEAELERLFPAGTPLLYSGGWGAEEWVPVEGDGNFMRKNGRWTLGNSNGRWGYLYQYMEVE
jgi:hypothetical protein